MKRGYLTPILFFALLLAGIGFMILRSSTDSVTTPKKSEQVLSSTQETTSSSEFSKANKTASSENVFELNENVSETMKNFTAVLKTTKGDISLELTGLLTPKTVNNFVTLAQKGFYDGTIFHRVINGFMIQGGDPKGDGTGGPGYTFEDEPFEGSYTRGTLAMANAGADTNGSQFFIMHKDVDLPKNYVIFGRVVLGIEVIDSIAISGVQRGPSGEMSKPVEPTKILSISIIEN